MKIQETSADPLNIIYFLAWNKSMEKILCSHTDKLTS